ncbi:MAG: TIGR04282 family arsenosugar biosynthesis glycosyltransferase [Bacteroidetes bacterium]|nr:TIGR04282 family arsenosugar biosynthesis glycosyltransferase [Bacteroidota bacterium]
MKVKDTLLIFAKNLIPGQVKTRLAASIGHDGALAVYQKLLQHTEMVTRNIDVDKTVFYSSFIEEQDLWDNEIYKKQLQSGTDLGERMQDAFLETFAKGHGKVVIIGTDCLEMERVIIMDAFAQLNEHDIVIGPAKDGGYYLLGMKKMVPSIFYNISWGTDKVLEETLHACYQLKISVGLLPILSDIDTVKDLESQREQLLR